MATQGLGEANPLFRHPRDFDRRTENTPFLGDSESDDAESESSSDDESDCEFGDDEDDEAASSAVRRSDPSAATRSDSSAATRLDSSAVRRLSRKLATEKPSPDSYQDAQVIKFVENGLNDMPDSSDELVALIDDQTDTVGVKSCRGGLTRHGFVEVVKKPRFTDPNMVHGHSDNESADINRRIIGIPGLAAAEMEVLAGTATSAQRDALLKFFRHHINPTPLIECDMSSSGFRTLVLHYHVPSMVLRQHRRPRKDPRRKPNGDPLRGSWPVECIPTTKQRGRWYLYQAQRSLAVVVIDERVWTAFGTCDIFFDGSKSKDSVARRHDLWAKDELRDRVAMDPMKFWRVYVPGTDGVRGEGSDGDLLSDPWLSFLANYEWALEAAQNDYAPIVAKMQEAVNNGYPADASGQAQARLNWNSDTLEHIRRIIACLNDLLGAWKTFQRESPRFLDLGANSRYLLRINRSFNTLEIYNKQFAELKDTLKRNEAAIKQQLQLQVRDGQAQVVDGQNYNQTLAKLIIYLSPLSQVMSLFNIQGLPFAFSPASFVVSFVVICLLWVVVYWLMEGTTVTTRGVYVRRYLGDTAAGVWERVWRGKEVFELEGSRPAGDGSTPVAAGQDPPALGPGPGPGPATSRSWTWPLSTRTRQERQDAGHAV